MIDLSRPDILKVLLEVLRVVYVNGYFGVWIERSWKNVDWGLIAVLSKFGIV